MMELSNLIYCWSGNEYPSVYSPVHMKEEEYDNYSLSEMKNPGEAATFRLHRLRIIYETNKKP